MVTLDEKIPEETEPNIRQKKNKYDCNSSVVRHGQYWEYFWFWIWKYSGWIVHTNVHMCVFMYIYTYYKLG